MSKRHWRGGLLRFAVCACLGEPLCQGQTYSIRAGDIVIANYDKGSVAKIDSATAAVQRLGGAFTVPTDVALDPAGYLYVSEWQGAIKRLDLADGVVTTVLPSGSGPSQIWGIALGPSGDVFVSSRGNHAVYRVDAAAGKATLVAQSNLLYTPMGIDLRDPDHLVVACLLTNRLVSISLTDNSQSVIKEGGGLDQPWGVAARGAAIYVAGFDRKELQRVSGVIVSTVATMADFPYGLGVDPSGNPVVGLKGVAGSVVRVSPQGTLLNTYAGSLIGQVTGVDVAQSSLPPPTDTDSDGMVDWKERVAGTDPLDPDSLLEVGASFAAEPSAAMVLEWPSVAGRVYSVLEAEDPVGSFTVLTNALSATPPVNLWSQAFPAGTSRFYRIGVQRVP